MLTDYISKSAVTEIGASVSEIFGVPLAITDLDGRLLFVSQNWNGLEKLSKRSYVNYLIKRSGSTKNPVVNGPGNECTVVIPIKFDGMECAYGIVAFDHAVDAGGQELQQVIEPLEKALGDVSLYASWAMKKDFTDLRSRAVCCARDYGKGSITATEVMDHILAGVVGQNAFDVAAVAFIDEKSGSFRLGCAAGDRDIVPECLEECGLAWWSVHEKKPVFTRSPVHDARCQCGRGSHLIKKTIMLPLFFDETVFGVLYLISRRDISIEPWFQDYIETMAMNISFLLELSGKIRLHSDSIRKISALNQISRILNTSQDVNTVLRLIADMARNLFHSDICCVYLEQKFCPGLQLMVARGTGPDEMPQLEGRFNQAADEDKIDKSGLVLLDFPIPANNRVIGYITLGGIAGDGLADDDHELMNTLCYLAGVAVENNRMYEENQKTLLETITVLSLAIEARDKIMFGHSEKVRDIAVAIAETMRLTRQAVAGIEAAGLLHDIGKLGIPEAVLNKPGSLNQQEYQEFQKHPVIGAQILGAVESFSEITEMVRHHHERYNGSGYPDGLKGEEIPLGSRILAVADTFSSLISKRSYRAARQPFEALEVIKEHAGTHFDPYIVKVFENVVRQRYSFSLDVNSAVPEPARPAAGMMALEMGLTERETEILACISAGMSNREIAAGLYLSEKTVKTHITHILKKLNLTDRTKAAVYAIQKGLVSHVDVSGVKKN